MTSLPPQEGTIIEKLEERITENGINYALVDGLNRQDLVTGCHGITLPIYLNGCRNMEKKKF